MVKGEQLNPTPVTQKRRWRIWLPPLFSLTLLVALIVHETRNPPAWQVAVERYLDTPRVEARGYAVTTGVMAQWPERFRAEMPFHPTGESVYYLTEAVAADTLVGSNGRKPLPYPPTEVWCFLLQGSAGAQKAILVARHDDFYNADWLVHEPTGDDEAVNQALAQIGCRFDNG